MTRNPWVLKKAQAEMDRVVGTERLPVPEDRELLLCLHCILKENLRWAPPVPVPMPHQSINADTIRGYEIPASCMIIANPVLSSGSCTRLTDGNEPRGMLHDPEVFPEPDQFIPERFAGGPVHGVDPSDLVFGFGRKELAEQTSWLMAAYIVATMEIGPAKDEDGKDVVPPADNHPGFVVHPKPFRCIIRPRSEKAAQTVKQMGAFA